MEVLNDEILNTRNKTAQYLISEWIALGVQTVNGCRVQINDYERNSTCSPATLIVLQAIICREWPDEQMFLSNFLHPTLTLRLLITAVPKP